MRGVRASGRGEAAGACEVQSVPPGPASAVGSCAALFAASLRGSGRGVYVGFKAKWVQIWTALLSLYVFYVGFIRVLHKTRVWSMLFMQKLIKTRVWSMLFREKLIKTRV